MNTHRFLIALALVALCGTAHAQNVPDIASPVMAIEQDFDVLHYDAWVDLTDAPALTMRGVCEITVRWRNAPAGGPFYFHLRDLKVDSAFYDGAPAATSAVGVPEDATYHYNLTVPATAKKDDTVRIRIVYSGAMTDELGSGSWGGVSSRGNTLFAMGVGFANNYVSATQHWMPCYDHPADKATFHGRFRTKQGMFAASNGVLLGATEADSTITYEWRHDIPCATYLLTFAVDAYHPLEFGTGQLPMVVYSRASDSAATRTTFKLLPDMVSAFETRFGEYPFEKVGYVNTPIGAMEHQTMISFPTSLSQQRDTVNSTGAHELSHQWFGDLVSPLDFRHAWLNESFATFCESVWEEALWGYTGYLKSQEAKANAYISSISRRENVFPLYDFPRASPSSNYPQTIYEKGAVVVGMLRFELGDSLFYGGMRSYLARHAYDTATTAGLRSDLESFAGRSLETFFNQWVYGRGWPKLNVKITPQPIGNGLNRLTVTLTQTQPDTFNTFTNVPVEFGFRSKADNIFTYRLVRLNAPSETFTLDSIPDHAQVTVNRGPSVRALLQAVVETSGVNDAKGSTSRPDGVQFLVHPNPLSTAAGFTVDVRGASECSGVIYELFDSAGQRMLVQHADECGFTVPTAGLNSGAYVLRFKFRGRSHDVPVVIGR